MSFNFKGLCFVRLVMNVHLHQTYFCTLEILIEVSVTGSGPYQTAKDTSRPPSPIPPVCDEPVAGSSGINTENEGNGQMEWGEEILCLLGEAPNIQMPQGKNVHEAISSRWLGILSKGVEKEFKEKMLKEYLVPGNCDLLATPVLNPEAKVAVTDFMAKRDQSLSQRQQQLGTALSALAQATEMVISKESTEKILKPLSDACRLLCDNHYQDTKTRRSLIVSALKPDLRETLVNTVRDKYLFGEKLADHLKSAQNIHKSGEGLKILPKQPFNKKQFINNHTSKNRLNYKGLHRQAPRADPGRSQQIQRPMTRSNRAQNQQQQQGRARSPAQKRSYKR